MSRNYRLIRAFGATEPIAPLNKSKKIKNSFSKVFNISALERDFSSGKQRLSLLWDSFLNVKKDKILDQKVQYKRLG
jgi:hypothetical protein